MINTSEPESSVVALSSKEFNCKFKQKRDSEYIPKRNLNQIPRITIITVVYNGGEVLENTIQSVICQGYVNLEYIIIDGGSSDSTIDVILKYEDKIDYWLSEKDTGIYDAMNKGILLATGDWVNFMNAGDSFFDSNVLKDIDFDIHDIGVIYGATNLLFGHNYSNIVKPENTDHRKTMPFIHQSCFVKSALMKCHLFDNHKFKLIADKNFFLKIANNGVEYKIVDRTISSCDAYGDSSEFSLRKEYEHFIVGYKYNKPFLIFHTIKLPLRVINHVIKKIIPSNIINKLRKKLTDMG